MQIAYRDDVIYHLVGSRNASDYLWLQFRSSVDESLCSGLVTQCNLADTCCVHSLGNGQADCRVAYAQERLGVDSECNGQGQPCEQRWSKHFVKDSAMKEELGV